MRRFAFLAVAVSSFTVALAAASCGGTKTTADPLPVTDDVDSGTTKPKRDSGGGTPGSEGGLPDAMTPPGKVYAHTKDTLYLFEPGARSLTMIGVFSCLQPGDAVLDIAVDRTGAMFATTYDYFLTVDPITAKCTALNATATEYPNSLSFVPAGTVDATKEALVGYVYNLNGYADHYVRIDTTTGAISDLGDLNPPGAAVLYKASGDFISLIQANDKTYLTVNYQNPEAGAPTTDFLAEVNPTTGQLVKVLGDTGQAQIFGLGYWAGKAYGFSFDGRISEISTSNGSAVVVKTLTDDSGTAVPWYGAGVTTLAPVTP